MITRTDAIRACKAAIKKSIQEVKAGRTKVRAEINTLAWQPQAEAVLPLLRAKQKEQKDGNRASAQTLRQEIKALRRPETGEQRYQLRVHMPCDPSCRVLLLTYGLLKDRPYKTVETKIRQAPEWQTKGLLNMLRGEILQKLGVLDPSGGWKEQHITDWFAGAPPREPRIVWAPKNRPVEVQQGAVT